MASFSVCFSVKVTGRLSSQLTPYFGAKFSERIFVYLQLKQFVIGLTKIQARSTEKKQWSLFLL